MANEIYISAISGLTPLIQLYQGASAIGSPFPATEIASTGEYVADMPSGLSYGNYLVVAMAGSEKIATGIILWDGNYEVVDSLGKLEGIDNLNPMTVTQVSRVVGEINLGITGDGETQTIVTRN